LFGLSPHLDHKRSCPLNFLLQLSKEIERFYRSGRKEVAKIVHCGEKIEEDAIRKGGPQNFVIRCG
jgi:hypothetical protein